MIDDVIDDVDVLTAAAGARLDGWWPYALAFLAGVVVALAFARSWYREERRLFHLFRQFGVRRRAAEWGMHHAVMARCDLSRQMAAREMEPGRVIAVAKVPLADVEEEPTGGIRLARSDLPARGARLPDLAETATFVAPEIGGLEALARRGEVKPDPGYGKPPRIEVEPRYPWPSLFSPQVLAYTRIEPAEPVEVVEPPAAEEPRPERSGDDEDPPAPPALMSMPSVTVTAIRRASHWPARMLRNAGRVLAEGARCRPNVTLSRHRVVPSSNAGRHHYTVAVGTERQNTARWEALAASGPRRCVR